MGLSKERELLPLEIGVNELTGWAGKRIRDENPYVKLLTDPKYDGKQYTALAIVEHSLCIISVKVTEKKERTEG